MGEESLGGDGETGDKGEARRGKRRVGDKCDVNKSDKRVLGYKDYGSDGK